MTDKVHTSYKGRIIARTCWSCDRSLTLADYNILICEGCEEPQPQDFQPTAEQARDWRVNGIN